MSFAVAVGNMIFFAWTGESLPSPTYGSLTRRGHEPNPGGAWSLTVVLAAFGFFCLAMHRRQSRKVRETKKRS